MATDLEKLVVQLSADIKGYERELRKAKGVTEREFRAVENRARSMSRTLDATLSRSARGLVAPLTGVAAALSIREVVGYAEAWTRAKNALAVAGIQGRNQEAVLDKLYAAAQANGAPIEALTDLYGKAAQAGDVLGATQEELIKFSGGVATALRVAGTGAGAASGALTQLGQLLGSTRVQAEEFNSVNEGARPILMAVAAGLDEAGGSVSKLKMLVNDGKVSGRQFFDAFLRGLPEIERMASGATQTIDQGMTKVNNALTKYIGETDSSLSATARLVDGLNALADNFDTVADFTLKVAAVIAGALVGRSIAGMIAKLGLGVVAINRFVQALAAARNMATVTAAISSIGTAAGPVGLVIGTVLTGALVAFGSRSGQATDAARAYAAALAEVEDAAKDADKAIEDRGKKYVEEQRNRLAGAIQIGEKEIAAARAELDKLFSFVVANTAPRLATPQQMEQIEKLRVGLASNATTAIEVKDALYALANANPRFQHLADQAKPFLDVMIAALGAVRNLGDELDNLGGGIPADPRAAGFRMLSQREATGRALAGRLAEAGRPPDQRDLDAAIEKRAKEIVDQFGDQITMAAARVQAQKELAAERSASGLSGAVSGYVNRTINAESGGNARAKNPLSSATGLGQFIESTWLDLFRRHFPAEASTRTRAQILELRNDAAYSKQLIETYARENAAILQKAGISVADAADEYKLHLAHFLGPKGAIAALQADPTASAASVLGADAARSNPTIIGNGRTISDVLAYAQRRAGQKTSGTVRLDEMDQAAADAQESQQRFDKALADQRRYIDGLKAETAIRATLNPLVDDYGAAMSAVEAAQYLLTAAQEEGTAAGKELKDVQQLLYGDLTTLSPAAREQAQAMREIAVATGEAEAAGRQLNEQNGKIVENAAAVSDFGKGLLSGFISDLKAGKSAGEALANTLSKIADKLLEVGLNALFDGPSGTPLGGPLGGIFGSLFGWLFKADGGEVRLGPKGVIRGPGGPRGDKIPTMLSDGEFVVNAEATRKNRELLEAINAGGLRMMADGGHVRQLRAVRPAAQPRSGRRDYLDINGTFKVENGNLLPLMTEVSGVVAGQQVRQVSRAIPSRMQASQRRGV